MSKGQVLVVGAGLSGAVLGRVLAEAGLPVTVVEARDHVAGNCHTRRDTETGVMVHVYGPHIFHTDDAEVWDYVNRFATFRPYRHRVKTTSGGQIYSLPINLHTINQFFGRAMSPTEARAFIATRTEIRSGEPKSFEEQALCMVGRDLYEAFLKGYTVKQWGCDPVDLPASILKRLPLRFDYNDAYFFHRHQAIPEQGYTAMVDRILDHPGVELRLNTHFTRDMAKGYRHVFHSGPLDGFFGHDMGRLGYRTLDFERFTVEGDHQGCAVMNHADQQVPFTRVTEHKHFAPWESHARSICQREYSRACGREDIPYYPIRLVNEKKLLSTYVERARGLTDVTFLGRLGTYRYLDMDVSIREALDTGRVYLDHIRCGTPMPAFVRSPL